MADIEQFPIKVINGYRLELTASEIKRVREIFYKVAFVESEMREARWKELRSLSRFAHDMMDLCDTYLSDWMEQTRQEELGIANQKR